VSKGRELGAGAWGGWTLGRLASVLAMTLLTCLAPDVGLAAGAKFCSATARTMLGACRHEAHDDFLTASAKCTNISNESAREECSDEAKASRSEALALCRDQFQARREVCGLVGEARYDPVLDPANFETNYVNPPTLNPYFPLKVGNRWEYQGGTETVVVEVLNETKLIEGVTCVVTQDQVTDDGDLIEDTDDWFCQAKDGAVHYFGEEVKNFETFVGDVPPLPELVGIDGSFKHGRDGDKAGIIFPATPTAGASHLEEFSLGNAEDVATVLSTTYSFGTSPDLDAGVPAALAQLLCADDCVVTRNTSPLEPGVVERKYYAKGIGFFLEIGPEPTDVVQLVDCNVDPRCAALPSP